MIDIHAHILPYIDDGAENMNVAIEMARMAYKSGVTEVVATPHFNGCGINEIKVIYEKFVVELSQQEIDIKVWLGMEVMASNRMEELICAGSVMGINHSRYMLLEFPFDLPSKRMIQHIKLINQLGLTAVIAHPERYFCVQKNPLIVIQFREMGCIIQVNKGSILGGFGHQVEQCSNFLLERHAIDVIASDAHGIKKRTPDMSMIKKYITSSYSSAYAHKLLEENPMVIARNGEWKK
ncbi:MAG: CpsB/CapC family capsule biosynthesis tyrosine phosphatase [Lachnospiraceae bacterium]